jgi:hypothetical protein
MRWFVVEIEASYPDIFGAPLTEEAASNIVFMDIFRPAAAFYAIWWVLFLFWMIVQGRFNSFKLTGYDTVYHNTMKNKSFAKTFCFDSKNPTSIIPVFIYMTFHGVLSTLAICWSWLTFNN